MLRFTAIGRESSKIFRLNVRKQLGVLSHRSSLYVKNASITILICFANGQFYPILFRQKRFSDSFFGRFRNVRLLLLLLLLLLLIYYYCEERIQLRVSE